MIGKLVAACIGFLAGRKIGQPRPAVLFYSIVLLDLIAIVLACFENSFAYLFSLVVGLLLLALGGNYKCNFVFCLASAFFQFFFLIGIAISFGNSMFLGYLSAHCLSMLYPLIKSII